MSLLNLRQHPHALSLAPAYRRAGRGAPGDSPLLCAAVGGVAGTVFVVLRLIVVAKGDITRFVFAGRDWVNPAAAPRGLHVFSGTGYDGQFYYRLALDPADLARSSMGITMDTVFRFQRILMPALSWVASAGHAALVPAAEVGVNLAALVGLSYLGALFARDCGRHAAWGLLVAGYWGFLFSIGRDLTEVVASFFLVGGLLALRRHRPAVAGLALTGAVLSVESTLDVVAAVALVAVVAIVRRRRRPGVADVAWVLPAAVFCAWQGVVFAVTGTVPLRADSGDNLAPPVVHMVGAIGYFLGQLPGRGALIWLSQFGVLAVVTLAAGWALWQVRIPAWEKLAWVIALLVAVSLAKGIWYGRADFRGFEDLYLLSVLALLSTRRRLWPIAVLVAIVWAATFGHYVVAL